jgi:hypothetical protein
MDKDFIRSGVYVSLSFQIDRVKHLYEIQNTSVNASIVNSDCNCWTCFCPDHLGHIPINPRVEKVDLTFPFIQPMLVISSSVRITSDDNFYYLYFITNTPKLHYHISNVLENLNH